MFERINIIIEKIIFTQNYIIYLVIYLSDNLKKIKADQ